MGSSLAPAGTTVQPWQAAGSNWKPRRKISCPPHSAPGGWGINHQPAELRWWLARGHRGTSQGGGRLASKRVTTVISCQMVFFSAGGEQFVPCCLLRHRQQVRGQHESVSVSSHSEGNSKSKELKVFKFWSHFYSP